MATKDEPQSATKRFQCVQCPKSFTLGQNLKEHIMLKHTEGKSKSSYSCEKCLENNQPSKSFATQRLLNGHIRRVHRPHPFKCQVCFKTFRQHSCFRKHQWIHSQQDNMGESEGHKCSLCSRIWNYKADLRKHMLRVHKKKIEGASYFKCELCDTEFATRSYLEEHVVRKHVVDKAFECHVCSKTFIDQDTLDKHIPKHDNKIKHFCDVCSNGFKHKKTLVRHLKVEHLKFFYCVRCSRSFRNKSEFDQHSHPPKTGISSELKLEFKCEICNESLDSQCEFDTHADFHFKEIISQQHQHEIKNLTDSTKNLNLPMRKLNDVENPNLEFQCELCSKVFDRQSYLQAHRNLVHPHAVWSCSFAGCTKTFKRNNQLRLHKLTHVGKVGRKPFVCRFCQKSFPTPYNLKRHVQTHAQHKEHKCGACSKSFLTPDTLRVHVANHHGGPKPFTCPVLNCGKSSANSSFLKRHLATHQTEKLFKCDLCSKHITFKSSQILREHRQRVHSGDYPSQKQNRTSN